MDISLNKWQFCQKKSNFDYRLDTPDRLGNAGIHKIGLGVLIGAGRPGLGRRVRDGDRLRPGRGGRVEDLRELREADPDVQQKSRRRCNGWLQPA